MDPTSVSLLRRLRQPNQDDAWGRFVEIYSPLIFHCGRLNRFSDADCDDLLQEVMTKLVVELPKFDYDKNGRFRGWLRTVTVNKIRDIQRRRKARPDIGASESIESPAVEDAVIWVDDDEFRRFVIAKAREFLEDKFDSTSWKAAWNLMIGDRTAEQVGREFGMTANAVRIAKSRVLRQLREEFGDMLE